jgi:hypothetical protein
MSAPERAASAAPGANSAAQLPKNGVQRVLDAIADRSAASARPKQHLASRCADLP